MGSPPSGGAQEGAVVKGLAHVVSAVFPEAMSALVSFPLESGGGPLSESGERLSHVETADLALTDAEPWVTVTVMPLLR